MNRRVELTLAWAGAIVLLLLHLDFWRSARPALVFGFVPEELMYRVVWMVGAVVYLWFFTARIWRGDP
ncbi:MAG: hypothetical protein RMA76_24010 [Deltaproteobacteria bacterium]